MGKNRDLFKKSQRFQGNIHAKMGTIKDRNGMDLTKAEDIKKRCQEYTVDYTKNIFITQIATLVVTHLEPDMPRMQSQVGVV